jgi:thioredoxin-like negative regulator of GroEL
MPKAKLAAARTTEHPSVTSRHQQRVKLWRFLILGGVAVSVIAILLIKQAPAAPAPTTLPSSSLASSSLASGVRATNELPEVQLMRALQARTPTLAFFHSMTCDSCKEMTAIVEEVYPEYADAVALVDVDVYDERNAALTRSAGIRAIPTVIFFDRSGASKVHMGVVAADDLRQILAAMKQGS